MEINLNLIPEYRKEEIKKGKRYKIFIWQALTVLLMAVVFGSILAGFNLSLKAEMEAALQSSIPASQIKNVEELKKYDEEFKEANEKISVLDEIQKGKIFWSNLFLELNQVIPDGVEIKNISTKKLQVFVSGVAITRDNLVTLKDRLENQKCFESINLPLSNFAAKDNVEFQLDFFIKDNCVKKK